MARFKLRPCKLREDQLVPSKEPDLVLDWRELVRQLAPSREIRARQNLHQLQPQAFVGLLQHSKGPVNFVLLNADRSGYLGTIMAKDATFAGRLLEVYRVEEAVWDSKVSEVPGVSSGPQRRL